MESNERVGAPPVATRSVPSGIRFDFCALRYAAAFGKDRALVALESGLDTRWRLRCQVLRALCVLVP